MSSVFMLVKSDSCLEYDLDDGSITLFHVGGCSECSKTSCLSRNGQKRWSTVEHGGAWWSMVEPRLNESWLMTASF